MEMSGGQLKKSGQAAWGLIHSLVTLMASMNRETSKYGMITGDTSSRASYLARRKECNGPVKVSFRKGCQVGSVKTELEGQF